MKGVDYFNTVGLLEPACPNCNVKIVWEETTRWNDEKAAQVCLNCGIILE